MDVTVFVVECVALLSYCLKSKLFLHSIDGIEISFYISTTRSNIQVMRIKEVIIKDKMS